MMTYYINSLSVFNPTEMDVKELIPDMNMRRRMSRYVKMGVATGICSLRGFGDKVEAIITATSLGALSDSEKFLNSIIENKEQMLNPTPFIQSTFNTIGAQIGLIAGNHCYNMTYSQRSMSFESAVLDAVLQLDLGQAESVLVGAVDEVTVTQENLFKRLKITDAECCEGAVFFVLSREAREDSIAKLEIVPKSGGDNHKILNVSGSSYSSSFSGSAFLFADVVDMVSRGEGSSFVIVNDVTDEEFLRLKISTL